MERLRKAVEVLMLALIIAVGILSIVGSGGSGSSDSERVTNNLEIEVENVINLKKGPCLVSGSVTWNPEKGKWVARVNHYNGTPEPSLEHPAFEYIKYLSVPEWEPEGAEREDWVSVDWQEFPCNLDNLNEDYFTLEEEEEEKIPNGLEIEVKNVINLKKGPCLVSGSVIWNPNEQEWKARVNHYNGTPKPSRMHPVFDYVKFLSVPDWEPEGAERENWVSLDWQGFPCDLKNLDEGYFH